ncbi:MAG TPA: type II secretion system protein [Gemmatimonadales bacterium]|nr:type II secretion system protein [Gemmatimonadales bacterium]
MRDSRRGFTFIEILIVVLILGMVAAFAAPKIDVTKFKVESAMQTMGMTLLALERQSIAQQHDIIVMFDQTQNALRVHEDNNNSGTMDAGERVRRIPLGDDIVFGRGAAAAMASIGAGPVSFTKTIGGYQALVFHRDGSASEAAGFYLTSRRGMKYSGYPQDSRAIVLDRATGRASWFRYSNLGAWVRAF